MRNVHDANAYDLKEKERLHSHDSAKFKMFSTKTLNMENESLQYFQKSIIITFTYSIRCFPREQSFW